MITTNTWGPLMPAGLSPGNWTSSVLLPLALVLLWDLNRQFVYWLWLICFKRRPPSFIHLIYLNSKLLKFVLNSYIFNAYGGCTNNSSNLNDSIEEKKSDHLA